jgi:hypothetical protein
VNMENHEENPNDGKPEPHDTIIDFIQNTISGIFCLFNDFFAILFSFVFTPKKAVKKFDISHTGIIKPPVYAFMTLSIIATSFIIDLLSGGEINDFEKIKKINFGGYVKERLESLSGDSLICYFIAVIIITWAIIILTKLLTKITRLKSRAEKNGLRDFSLYLFGTQSIVLSILFFIFILIIACVPTVENDWSKLFYSIAGLGLIILYLFVFPVISLNNWFRSVPDKSILVRFGFLRFVVLQIYSIIAISIIALLYVKLIDLPDLIKGSTMFQTLDMVKTSKMKTCSIEFLLLIVNSGTAQYIINKDDIQVTVSVWEKTEKKDKSTDSTAEKNGKNHARRKEFKKAASEIMEVTSVVFNEDTSKHVPIASGEMVKVFLKCRSSTPLDSITQIKFEFPGTRFQQSGRRKNYSLEYIYYPTLEGT